MPAGAQTDSGNDAGSNSEESQSEASALDGEGDDGASEGGGAGDIGTKVFDVIVIRPPAAVKLVVGIPFCIVSVPFIYLSGGASDAWDIFVVEPFDYTFARPLGDF